MLRHVVLTRAAWHNIPEDVILHIPVSSSSPYLQITFQIYGQKHVTSVFVKTTIIYELLKVIPIYEKR
jgi:hypothetical protein